jgi:hypothetical protein
MLIFHSGRDNMTGVACVRRATSTQQQRSQPPYKGDLHHIKVVLAGEL